MSNVKLILLSLTFINALKPLPYVWKDVSCISLHVTLHHFTHFVTCNRINKRKSFRATHQLQKIRGSSQTFLLQCETSLCLSMTHSKSRDPVRIQRLFTPEWLSGVCFQHSRPRSPSFTSLLKGKHSSLCWVSPGEGKHAGEEKGPPVYLLFQVHVGEGAFWHFSLFFLIGKVHGDVWLTFTFNVF